jgi:midasin
MKALSQAFDDALLPSLDALVTSPSSLDALGTAWIVLGRALLQLYVPDRPVDPAAMAGCAAVYWQREVDNLASLIAAHSSQSLKHYGHPRNSVVDWLNARLVQASERLESVNNKPLPGHREIGAVHAFWSEVSHFLQEVIPGQKMNALMQSIRDGHEGSRLRAEVVQESISGFVQRLDAGYPEFADLSLPLQWALAQIRLGLALVSTFAERTADAHFSDRARFASSLVIFPSPHAAEQLRTGARAPPSPGVSITDLLSLRLAAVNVEHHMGSQDIDSLNLLFEQLLRLWLIDRSNEEKVEKEGQSLYRSKALDHEARSDAEIEEEEFMSMFPAYEEAEETLKPDNARPTQQSGGRNIDSAQLHVVCSIHLELFGKASKDMSGQIILNNMRSTIIGALHSSPLLLPETLDDDSMAVQMAMLHGLRESTTSSTSPSNAGFDFYRDPCVPQVERAALAVVAMERRLEELVQEWPDQMVLQHLQQRCQAVLALRLDSPVAKVLSSLEQLLLQSEDWEMYANRHNSLRAHREELIKIIVDWRRLELSCWQRLLEGQLKFFEDQTSEWWPRLYDACVRGPLSAFDQGDEAALDKYLESLLPLLDDLLATSPMGQYARRLELIESFERFLSALSDARSTSDNAVLSRVRRILHSTCSFYAQFSQKIATSFASQRAALEKDVRGYIKLASWKDVNVQALKASAVRTHHQLYKTIRKFREIMRQAVSDQLQFEHATSRADAEDLDRHAPATLVLAEFRYAATTIPSPLSDNTRPHLSDLPRTLAKFSSLVTTRLHPSLVTRDALAVDDFTSDIILRSKELAETSVPADLPAAKREQQQKTLLLQKRKAWSDLLKELKRVGFAINMKPEVLEAQRSRRWVREQQGFDGPDPLACKAEAYFNRLQALLPTLRNALADHHADIQTRDVQRAIMFVESALSIALHARSS